MIDPLTTISAISAGLKLIEQFREVALRAMGRQGSEPSVTVRTRHHQTAGGPERSNGGTVDLEIKRRGGPTEIVRSSDLRMGAWDQQRYDTLQSVVGILFEQFNSLETQAVMTSGLQQIQIKQQMDVIKKQLCPKFREMLKLYEQTLGVNLEDHFALFSVCGQC
jgi:hypothetical protein